MGGLDESDSRRVARLMKSMGEELGEDVRDMDALLDPPDEQDEGIGHSDSF